MIVVCMKWVATRPTIDPISGDVVTDARWSGASAADLAALELALCIGEQRSLPVTVLTLGPTDAESLLRDAIAAGAQRAVRIDESNGAPSHSVAVTFAECMRTYLDESPALVMCGDWSLDRGSGSVPVFIAQSLGLPDVCGVVAFTVEESVIRVERRLDAGRREILSVRGPAVISVEGSVARLRRAPLQGALRAQKATIEIWRPANPLPHHEPVRTSAFRPRARVLDGPPTSASPLRRVEILTGAHTERTPPKRVALEPKDAADLIVDQLVEWGYLTNEPAPSRSSEGR